MIENKSHPHMSVIAEFLVMKKTINYWDRVFKVSTKLLLKSITPLGDNH